MQRITQAMRLSPGSLLGLWLLSGAAWAEPAWLHPSGSFQVHGFATQTAIHTTDNRLFGNTDDNLGFEFREFGLNASWLAHPDLLFSVQGLYREAGETEKDERLQLDYGFVDWATLSGDAYRVNLSLGRVKNPFGLYNETRDVAFTRSGILLPQSVYPERIRKRMLSGDGAYLRAEYDTEDLGSLQLSGGVYEPQVSDDFTQRVLGQGSGTPQGDLEPNTSWITRLLWEFNGGQYRLAVTRAGGDMDYDPGAGDPVAPGRFRFSPLVLSAQYNGERLSLTSEYALRNAKFSGFGPPRDRDFDGEGWYVEGTYRFRPGWEGLLRYDVSYADKDDRDGNAYQARTGRPAHNRYAKDWTLGLRWDIAHHLMLRAEYHHINGAHTLPLADNPDLTRAEPDWDMFAVLISAHF